MGKIVRKNRDMCNVRAYLFFAFVAFLNFAFAEEYFGPDGFFWKSITSLPESMGPYYGVAFDPQNLRVYVVGGYSSNQSHTGSNSVYLGKIQSNNDIVWSKLTNYPKYILGAFCFTNGVRLYCLGGDDGSSVLSESYCADINPDGTIGSWRSYLSLPQPLHFHAGLFYKNMVFILGGRRLLYYDDVSDNSRDEIYRKDGDRWTLVSRLPTPLDAFAVTVYNGKVYISGGQITWYNGKPARCHVNRVFFTTISDSGEFGSWQETTSLPDVDDIDCGSGRIWPSKGMRAYHHMVAYDGYLYVFPAASFAVKGDCSVNQQQWLSSTLRTLRAKINPDGSLGNWELVGPRERNFDCMNWQQDKMGTNVYGGFLLGSKFYLIAGMNYAGVTKAAYYMNLLREDMNDDSLVNSTDVKILLAKYLNSDIRADLNSDNVVNNFDTGLVVKKIVK